MPQSSRPQHVPCRPGPQRPQCKAQTSISGLDNIPLYVTARCNPSPVRLHLLFSQNSFAHSENLVPVLIHPGKRDWFRPLLTLLWETEPPSPPPPVKVRVQTAGMHSGSPTEGRNLVDRYAVPHRINRKPGEPNSE